MTKFKNLWIAVAVLLFCAGCASKKVAVQRGAELIQTNVTTNENTETKTVETIKTEKFVDGDTIRRSVPASDIKKPTGVVIENQAQRITINYDTKSDSFIVQGIQKAKRELQEIKREITQKANKETADKSKKESETHNETALPAEKKGLSGVEWGFFWACLAAVAWIGWKFRGGILSFFKKLL